MCSMQPEHGVWSYSIQLPNVDLFTEMYTGVVRNMHLYLKMHVTPI